MSKVLVVFYSYTGTSRRVTYLLSSKLGWPSGEVIEQKERTGLGGLMRCVFDSMLLRQPRIRYQGPEPKNFDTVVLLAPIWAFRLASPMRSFVAQLAADLPKVAMVSVMGGSGAPHAVTEVARLLGRSSVLSASFTAREIQDGSFAQGLMTFSQALQGSPG